MSVLQTSIKNIEVKFKKCIIMCKDMREREKEERRQIKREKERVIVTFIRFQFIVVALFFRS